MNSTYKCGVRRQPTHRKGKEPRVYWVVRWIDAESDRDMATVIDAAARGDAEAAARGRGIPFIFIARASQADVEEARAGRLMRLKVLAAAPYYTCLGRPLAPAQLAALLLLGVATALLHLRPILPAIVS